MQEEVFVAAGSNIDPLSALRTALDALAQAYGALKVSPAYRNKAVGFDGEDFVNLVVGFHTSDAPVRVRERLQGIEALCGRPPAAPKWAPRPMDLDILLYGQLISDEPGLVLPRPDLVRRAYMLKPMADIAPDLRHPTLGKTMRELWEAFDRDAHPLVPVVLH
jgi:2-amino-4-hydroxy-6-hydroxymethyldihydropteridine diphosphokinase